MIDQVKVKVEITTIFII